MEAMGEAMAAQETKVEVTEQLMKAWETKQDPVTLRESQTPLVSLPVLMETLVLQIVYQNKLVKILESDSVIIVITGIINDNIFMSSIYL